jgi:hypothetical protein
MRLRRVRLSIRRLLVAVAVVALLVVIVPEVIRELRRYIIGSPAGRQSWEGDSSWIRFRGG